MAEGVLLVRRVGDRLEAVDVPGAIAWPTAAQRELDDCLDALGVPRSDSPDTIADETTP